MASVVAMKHGGRLTSSSPRCGRLRLPELTFRVEGVEAARFAAAPLLNFKLRIDADRPVHTIALRCQIRIEPVRRRYQTSEQPGLVDLFGSPERWKDTLHSMLWTHTNIVVPTFSETTLVDLPAPCTFDFNVASTKYFSGLEQGHAPLTFLFSGAVFYESEDGALRVTQIPWSKEADYDLPVAVWKEMMDAYYPNTAWLCLRRDTFDRLHRYKMDRGIPTWEQALESMLP
jgi:hypothetical protein